LVILERMNVAQPFLPVVQAIMFTYKKKNPAGMKQKA